MTRSISCLTFLSLAIFAGGQAGAEILAHEGFDYEPGAAVVQDIDAETSGNLNGGSGWAEGWQHTDGNSLQAAIAPEGLSHDSVKSAGRAIALTQFSSVRRNYVQSDIKSGVYYISAIMKVPSGAQAFVTLGDYKDAWNWSDVKYNVGFGITADGKAVLTNGSDSKLAGTDNPPAVAADSAHLLVVKLDFDKKTASLFVNQSAEGTPDIVAPFEGGFAGIRLTSLGEGNESAKWVDEISIAESYTDIVPADGAGK